MTGISPFFLIWILGLIAFQAWTVTVIAKARGRSPGNWIALTLLFGPIAVISAWLVPDARPRADIETEVQEALRNGVDPEEIQRQWESRRDSGHITDRELDRARKAILNADW